MNLDGSASNCCSNFVEFKVAVKARLSFGKESIQSIAKVVVLLLASFNLSCFDLATRKLALISGFNYLEGWFASLKQLHCR